MSVYLIRCQYGDNRYFATATSSGLACTRCELQREVIRRAGVNALHVVAVEHMPNLPTAGAVGEEWSENAAVEV